MPGRRLLLPFGGGRERSKLQFSLKSMELFSVALLEGKGIGWRLQHSSGGSRFDWSVLDMGCELVKLNDRYRSTRKILSR